MSESESGQSGETTDSDGNDGIARLNVRIPQAKYEWLQEELDSFTSDTARLQYLIQFYSDHKQDESTGE